MTFVKPFIPNQTISMTKHTKKYLEAESAQTLREGVMELRRAETAENDAAETFAPELKHDIDVHDAIHVIFACQTTLAGEIIAHVWTAFGTTASLAEMHRVNRHADHRAVLAQIGHRKLLRVWLTSLPRILTTILNAFCMKRRWRVEDMDSFLDQRLCDIRREHRIRLSKTSRTTVADEATNGASLRSIRSKLPSLVKLKA